MAVFDVFRLARNKLAVRRIVPPDKARKIVGWVELSTKEPDKLGKVVELR